MALPLVLNDWENLNELGEAVVINWFVRPGQYVKNQQLLAEVMVEKTSLELFAPAAGRIAEISAPEGTIITPGTVLGLLEETAEADPTPPSSNGKKPGTEIKSRQKSPDPNYIPASPAARRLARLVGIELAELANRLKPGERINEAVVRAHMAMLVGRESYYTAEEDVAVPYHRQRQSGLRRLIRQRVSRSARQVVAVTLTARADVTELLDWLENQKSQDSCPPTLLAAVIRATALALVDYPLLNSTLNGDNVLFLEERNIGIVLPVLDGVVVPVVRSADRATVAQLAAGIARFEESARQGTLQLKDTGGGTFTISDLGMFRVDSFTPILNLAQAAGLGIGRVVKEAVWPDEPQATRPVFRHFLSLNFIFDHRIADGPTAAACLQALVERLENPATLG